MHPRFAMSDKRNSVGRGQRTQFGAIVVDCGWTYILLVDFIGERDE